MRPLAVAFVGDKEFQRGQHEGSEPALFRIGAIEVPSFEHADEELLREILRLVSRITASANIRVQRIPVALAQ